MKKYELVKDDVKYYYGLPLFRIRALKKLHAIYQIIQEGDLGGYVGCEPIVINSNLAMWAEDWFRLYREWEAGQWLKNRQERG